MGGERNCCFILISMIITQNIKDVAKWHKNKFSMIITQNFKDVAKWHNPKCAICPYFSLHKFSSEVQPLPTPIPLFKIITE